MVLVADKTDISKHVNLSPFWGWISAAECLLRYQKNYENECKGNEVLTLAGRIDVENSEDYCKGGGCGDRTKDVLDCIRSVKRDFRFTNNANVDVVYNAIADGCRPGSHSAISTVNYTSSGAMKLLASNWILFVSMVASLFFHIIIIDT